MMSRCLVSSRLLASLLGAALIMVSGLVRAAPQVLKIATVVPDGTAWMNSFRGAAGEVEKRTEGRVSFRFFPGGVMGSDRTVLRKIQLGTLSGAIVSGGAFARVAPDIQIYSQPLLFRSTREVDYVRERMDPLIYQAIERAGWATFGIAEGGFAYLMSREPVRGLKDLRGQKVWAPEGDEIGQALHEAAGVSPVVLPISDVGTGLQAGLVDTVAAPPIGALSLQWHARVRYLTDFPWIYTFGVMAVDHKAFGRIAAPDQEIVRSIFSRLFQQLGVQSRIDNEKARAAMLKGGVVAVTLTPEGEKEFQRVARQAQEQLVTINRFDADLRHKLAMWLSEVRTHPTANDHGSGSAPASVKTR